MNEGQVVARLPLVADEQAAVAIVPAVGALDDPSSWFAASAAHQGLFTTPTDVRRHVAIPDLLLGVGVVVPLVQAEVVRTTRASGAPMNDSVERGTGHPLVVNVGAGQLDADRHAPRSSVRTWRFVPSFARSVGLGPVWSPPLELSP